MFGPFTNYFGKSRRQCLKNQNSTSLGKKKPQSLQKEQNFQRNAGSLKYLKPQISKNRDWYKESVEKQNEELRTSSSSFPSVQIEDETLYFKHCKTLNIEPQDGMDIEKVKKHFKTKITSNTQFKNQCILQTDFIVEKKEKKRIPILLAYHYLTCRIFGTRYSSQETMLIEAILSNDVQEVTRMINLNKQLISFRTKEKGNSVLYLAAMSGHIKIVETIINTAYKFTFEKNSSTPAHIAAWCGHYHVTKLLLRYFVPHNLPNEYGNLLIDEASNPEIEDLLEDADIDPFNQLILNLIQQSLLVKIINIVQNGEIVIRKIILKNHFKSQGSGYVTAFHGTKMQNLLSIAMHGLKKPDTKVGDSIIKVSSDSIQPNVIFNGDQNWANNIFASPSIHYAFKYSHPQFYYDQKSKASLSWKPIVQLKVKKNGFESFRDTTGGYQRVQNEPEDLEYKIADERNVNVVALLLVKRCQLGEFPNEKQADYRNTIKIILES